VPVTAKLSQEFYQRLGDDIATELVEWFNAVDATYRSDVRAIADAQSARIDAQMGQLRAELRQEIGALGADLRQEIGELRSEMRIGFASVGDKFQAMEPRTDAKLERLKSEMLRWMLAFWVGTVGAILAMTKL
jgi:hypothetical protein